MSEIREGTGNNKLSYDCADFESLSEVRGRVERITAEHERLDDLNLDDIMLERSYDGIQAYCQSKLAVIMLTINRAGAWVRLPRAASCCTAYSIES